MTVSVEEKALFGTLIGIGKKRGRRGRRVATLAEQQQAERATTEAKARAETAEFEAQMPGTMQEQAPTHPAHKRECPGAPKRGTVTIRAAIGGAD